MRPIILRGSDGQYEGAEAVRVVLARGILDDIYEEAPMPVADLPRHGISLHVNVIGEREVEARTIIRPLRNDVLATVIIGDGRLRFNLFEYFKEKNGDLITSPHGTEVAFLQQHLALSGMAYTICKHKTERKARGYKTVRMTHTIDVITPVLSWRSRRVR